MKVRELIGKLQQLDGELDILCSTEDEDLVPSGHLFRLFEITSVDVVEAERQRADDRVPSFKLGRSGASQKHVVLEVTGVF